MATPTSTSMSMDITASIDQALAASREATQGIKQGQDSVDKATQEVYTSINNIYSAKKTVALAEQTAALQAQQANSKLIQAAGGHAAQEAMMLRLVEDESRLEALQNKATDIMDDKFTGIGIIDGVINAFRSVNTGIQIGSVTAERDQTLNQIKNVTAATESFGVINSKFQEAVTAESVAATGQAIEAEGKRLAANAKLEAQSTGAERLAEVANSSMKEVQARIQAASLEGAIEQRELAKTQHAHTIERLNFEKEQWPTVKATSDLQLEKARAEYEDYKHLRTPTSQAKEAELKGKFQAWEDKEAREKEYVKRVQLAEARYNLTPSPDAVIKHGLDMQDTKYWTLVKANATGKLGNTPADAAETWSTLDPTGTVPLRVGTSLLQRFNRIVAEKQQAAMAQGIAPAKDEAVLKAQFNTVADEEMARYAANIIPNSANPLEAPPMGILATYLEKKNIPLYDKVIKDAGMMETIPQTILDRASLAALNKLVTPEQAAQGLVDIFSTAADVNNAFEDGFTDIGLAKQDSYRTELLRKPGTMEMFSASLGAALQSPLLSAGGPASSFIALQNKESEPGATLDRYTSTRTKIVNLMDYNEALEIVTENMIRLRTQKK